MQRYDLFCSLDGGGPGKEEENSDGQYVRFEDAEAAIAAAVLTERNRLAGLLFSKAEMIDCDCGCEMKKPKDARAVTWMRASVLVVHD